MTLEEYTLGLGKILVNFHSLEFSLRMFLRNAEDVAGPPEPQIVMHQLKVGQSVPVNAFSNYDTLGTLVKKFNTLLPTSNQELSVDESIVHLRDALAHGRVWAQQPNPPLQLVKFAQPTGGQAIVTHAETVDEEWLKSNTTRVRVELEKVAAAGRLLQPGNWPAA